MLGGDYFYYKMGRLKIVLMVVSKGQKLHKNYKKDPIGETHNPIIQRFNKSRGYSTITPLYKGNRA